MELNPLGLIDRAALEHLQSKTLLPGFSHWDVWLDQHAYAFTVAKMMDEDMLSTVKNALTDAIANGTDFRDFKARLQPYLMAQGWWGVQVMDDPLDGKPKAVELGSTRRLKTIFETNLATAHAAGQWARIETDAAALPYLRYNPSAAGNKRDSHKRYYGLVLPVQHPIWQQIFPPNGYGCQCSVSQLTRRQAERAGISAEPDIEMEYVENPRTGEEVEVPVDITPSFAHNHARRTQAVLDLAAQKHGTEFAAATENELAQYLAKRAGQELLSSSDNIIAEGKRLFEKHRETIITAFEQKQPHLGIAEVMRLEGVATGGEVLLKGSVQDWVDEFYEAVSLYPESWLQASNTKGVTVVEAVEFGREFHTYLSKSAHQTLLLKRPPDYDHFFDALHNKTVDVGGSLVSIDIAKPLIHRRANHVHEFAHRLQAAMPELNDLFVRLWHERTKGEAAEPLRVLTGNMRYGKNEIAKKDGFPDPYYGKMYGDESNPLPKEMMTMTFESLLGGNPARFAQLADNPDFFHFGLALLLRYKP